MNRRVAQIKIWSDKPLIRSLIMCTLFKLPGLCCARDKKQHDVKIKSDKDKTSAKNKHAASRHTYAYARLLLEKVWSEAHRDEDAQSIKKCNYLSWHHDQVRRNMRLQLKFRAQKLIYFKMCFPVFWKGNVREIEAINCTLF